MDCYIITLLQSPDEQPQKCEKKKRVYGEGREVPHPLRVQHFFGYIQKFKTWKFSGPSVLGNFKESLSCRLVN